MSEMALDIVEKFQSRLNDEIDESLGHIRGTRRFLGIVRAAVDAIELYRAKAVILGIPDTDVEEELPKMRLAMNGLLARHLDSMRNDESAFRVFEHSGSTAVGPLPID